MSSCASIDALVTPFVDGELSGPERTLVEQHLRLCSLCRSRVDAEQTVCHLLRAQRRSLATHGAPEGLRSRCCATGATRVTSTESRAAGRGGAVWVGRVPSLAAAAVILLAAGGALVYRVTFGATQAIAAELTADHVKCLMLNAVMRTHDSLEDVQTDLHDGFGWTARLPESSEPGNLELVGSRPCLYEHGKIAHIMYRYKGVPVSIFMLPGQRQSRELLQSLGHEAVVWSDDERTFVLIAKAPRADVEQLAAFVQTSLR